VHQWINERARGGKPGVVPPGGKGEARVDGVHCQRLGHAGALQRLFEVAPPVPAAAIGSGPDRSRRGGPVERVLGEFASLAKAVQGGDRKAEALIGKQSRFSANMWIRRTGWPRHLRGFDREWLDKTTRKPDPGQRQQDDGGEEDEEDEAETEARAASEEALAKVLLAVEREIWRAQRAS
jgi:hypothetical protein